MTRHLIITGGSGGIGSETARQAARAGHSVTLIARAAGRSEADEAASEIVEAGGSAVVAIADVTRDQDVVAAFSGAANRFGPPTGVLNAAGITGNFAVRDLEYSTAMRMMSVNVVGLMLCCREAIRHMSIASGGSGASIVNVSSMAATIGGCPGASVYAATRGAVDVFTTGLAREVAREGIRVNAVRPGMIATRMTENLEADPKLKKSVEASIPLGRLGWPDEVAEVALWPMSPAASLLTGAHINAGGGGFHVAAAT